MAPRGWQSIQQYVGNAYQNRDYPSCLTTLVSSWTRLTCLRSSKNGLRSALPGLGTLRNCVNASPVAGVRCTVKTRLSNGKFSGPGAFGASAGRKQGRDAASVVRLLLGHNIARFRVYVYAWLQTCSDGRRPLLALSVRECVSHNRAGARGR